MGLTIHTTGLEEYAPGGTARVKVLNIGGPGAGKTRWSSYFPQPIYADCERGLASVADRRVPFVTINTSQDMLDLLAHLKQECAQPLEQRQFHTVVIDTLDAFQRKIKNEWMERERKMAFQGWEAWGYLNARMQMLMTRLLNLDMNVVVNVHYKDRVTKDDATGKESHELMLQLQGETADTAFNDFDLVGWTGTYFEAVDGERVQKRGITFTATPDKPFLKDRLHVTPSWLEIDFAPSDYENLFKRIQAKIDLLEESSVVGEVPSETSLYASSPSTAQVVAPGQIGTGAIPGASSELAVPYTSMDKPTLTKLCRDRNITTTVDGAPLKGNTLKAELVAALEKYDAADQDTPPETPADPAPTPAPQTAEKTSEQQYQALAESQDDEDRAHQKAMRPGPVANAQRTRLVKEPEGTVNTETGELVEDHATAVEAVSKELGGVVVEDTVTPVPEPAPQAAVAKPGAEVCEECGKPLAGEDPDFIKLSWIRFRKKLCENDFRNYKKR